MFKLVAVQRVALDPEAVTFSTLPWLVLDTILSYLDRSSLLTMRRLNSELKEISRYRLTLEMQLDASQTMGLDEDPVDMLFLKPLQFLKHLTVPIRQSFVAMKMLRQANLSECDIENVLKFNRDAFNAFPLVFQMLPLSGVIMNKNKLTFLGSNVSGTLSLKTRKYGAVKSFQISTVHHAILYESGRCEIYYNILNNRKTPKLMDTLSDCQALFSCKRGFLIQSKRSSVFYVFKDGYIRMGPPLELPENQSVVKIFPLKEAIYIQLSNLDLIGVGMSHFGNITCTSTVQSIYSSGQDHFLAALDDHSCVTWGVGYSHPQTRNVPQGRTIKSVFWASKITISLLDDGTHLIWKPNPSDIVIPFPRIPKDCAVKNIYCSRSSFIAALDNNDLYGWRLSKADQSRLTECSKKGIQSIYSNQHGYVVLLNNGRVEFIPDPISNLLFKVPPIPNDRCVKAVYPSMQSFLLVLDNHDIVAILMSDQHKSIISALPKGEPISRLVSDNNEDIFTILYKNNKLLQVRLPSHWFVNGKNRAVYENCVKLDGKNLLSLDNLMKNEMTSSSSVRETGFFEGVFNRIKKS